MNLPLNTNLTGKVAVVTGAAGTLCSVFSKALAASGAKVALLGRTYANVQKLADEITAEGGTAKAYECNVLDKGGNLVLQVVVAQKHAVGPECGRVDYVAACGGIGALQVKQRLRVRKNPAFRADARRHPGSAEHTARRAVEQADGAAPCGKFSSCHRVRLPPIPCRWDRGRSDWHSRHTVFRLG